MTNPVLIIEAIKRESIIDNQEEYVEYLKRFKERKEILPKERDKIPKN